MGRRDECPHCRRDARICYNCRFYDPVAYRECREPQAEWVKEKVTGNFCGYFSASTQQRSQSASDATRSKLDALFGGGPMVDSPKASPEANLSEELKKFMERKK